MFKKIGIFLEMIKFRLTVFALPFALMGAFLAGRGVPDVRVFFWLVLAMIGARSCAMGFNRIVDRVFDQKNPRTAKRAIPTGEISLFAAWFLVIVMGLMFFISCFMLNKLALMIAPFALFLALFYSFTKRFTSLCHLVLGVALAFSPLGGWVAVSGNLEHYPFILSVGVLFWVAGFDTVYACMDAEFDRQEGLFSLPAKIGLSAALSLAAVFHLLALLAFFLTGVISQLNYIYFIGLGVAALLFIYQHILVRINATEKIGKSFFTMNGTVSITIFFATWFALLSTN
jgi:4-hydroxybenzoate polyprenyltransferase